MEIKFSRKPLSCMRQILMQVQSQELTQELKLPDDYPDIGRLLGFWGQVILRGKEWRRTSISANGGVMVWVMYAPEDGSQARILDTWMPFQNRWEVPDGAEDGIITVHPVISDLEGRNISARKIVLRADIDLLGQAMEAVTVHAAFASEVPEDVQLHTKNYPVELPVEAGERQVRLEELVGLPSDLPQIERIISYELHPEIKEQKVLANRLVFRGTARFQVRFLSDNAKVNQWTYEIPFSDYTELKSDYDTTASAWIVPVVTALEVDIHESSQLEIRAAIAAQYAVFDRMMLPITVDAYSPYRDVAVSSEELELAVLLDRCKIDLPISPVIHTNAQQILDVVVRNKHPYLLRDEDGTSVRMTGNCQMLYLDEEGGLQSENVRYEHTLPFDCALENRVALWQGNQAPTEYTKSVQEVTVKTQCPITAFSYFGSSMSMITGMEIGDRREADPNRPSLILRRAGKDDLWQIAKKYGSTVDAIRTANNLTNDPQEDTMLLVPVS